MRVIKKPALTTGSVLSRCGSGPRIGRVTALRQQLMLGEELLLTHLRPPFSAWSVPKNPLQLTTAELADVSWAYDNKMGFKEGPARAAYDVIRGASHYCPICLARTVEALDHYLPREVYPELSITPGNLVPICSDCNTAKLAKVATGPTDQFLHPYFDDLGGDEWIFSSVQEVRPATVLYSVRALPHWDSTLVARVQAHFSRFRLGELWAISAGTLLSSLRGLFEREYLRAGVAGVRAFISDEAASYWAGGAEPWRASALDAWARSDWFCDGGWR